MCYRDCAPWKSTNIDCYVELKCGRTNTDNAECSRSTKLAVVPKNIKTVHQIVLKDHKVNLSETANTLKISKVFTILHKNLSMNKLFRNGSRVCSHRAKNNNASTIQIDR